MEAFQRVKVRSKLLKDALECDGDEGCGCGLAAVQCGDQGPRPSRTVKQKFQKL